MLEFFVIGPGRHDGNYLAGYLRPGTREFVPLADCNTKEQAKQAAAELRYQQQARELECQPPIRERRVIRGFYNDASMQ